jgi:acyl-CoA thioesterase
MSQFDDETRLTALGDGAFEGQVAADWSIGSNPNGGYLLALAAKSIAALTPEHPDPLSITVHYLRPGLGSQPFRIHAQVLRSGRQLSTCRATLMQDDSARIEVMAAFGNLGAGAPAVIEPPAPAIAPPEQCIPRSGDQQGIKLPIMDRLDIRLHPDEVQTKVGGRAQITGWIRFKDGRDPDPIAALLFADAFPPSVFGQIGAVGWVPTVELTVHLRRRPAHGWILGQFRTGDLADGRMIEDGTLWDANGRLIAQSRQLALVRQPG